MKIEETPLTRYLVKNLKPLTEADPALLAKYVVALLKKNKSKKELQKLCVDKLYDFLGDGTKSFVTKLFHALEDGSITMPIEEVEGIKLSDIPVAVVSGDLTELRSSSPQPERLPSTAVRAFNELEEKEISDDDDDDRNHKHRRRVSRSQSSDQDGQDEDERRPSKKRGRPSDNGQSLQEGESQFSECRREYVSSRTEREGSVKYEKKRHGSTPSPRLNVDGGQRAVRGSQAYRNEPAGRFDVQNSFVRPVRGRGRSSGAWTPHDTRFAAVETVDFTLAMPQGHTSANLYSGRAIPNPGNSANSSWNPFGLIPGLPNGSMEQLHPLHAGLQGGRGAPLNATIGIGMGMGRPRCRDFEERGFCLRGDMCPMEHGVNRIVVEDVQSLSQFNLPVLPSGPLLGMKTGQVGGPSAAVVSSLTLASKMSYNNKYGTNDVNGLPTSSAGNEPDLYDPDQPLWNKDHPDASGGLMQLSPPMKGESEHLWDGDSSDRHSSRLSDGDSERPGRSIGTTAGPQNAVPSVWGRIGPIDRAGNKLGGVNRIGNTSSESLQSGKHLRKEACDVQQAYGRGSSHQQRSDNGIDVDEGIGAKGVSIHLQQGKGEGLATTAARIDSGSHLSSGFVSRGNGPRGNRGKGSEKAWSTLFVNCIPPKSNRREILLSHFQKFGEVLDIHIPTNTERAFVQFCRREDAEAALTAPDAVLGNRFIRLSWANRDSILVAGESSVTAVPPGRISNIGIDTLPAQQQLVDKGKEKICDAPAITGVSMSETLTTEVGALKLVTANGLLASSTTTLQKKQETLEILKEEVRRKQEMLAQKRDEFRRQLDKLEKQGTVNKIEVLDTNQGTQQKAEEAVECTNLSTKSCHTNLPPHSGPDNRQLVPKSNSGDVPNQMACSSLLSPGTISQPSPKSLKLPLTRLTRPVVAPMFIPNRYKLDNRPTAFRILPPLPEGLLDIGILKEHFSVFGDLSSVELDDIDGHFDKASKAPIKCAVRVTYANRRAAEKAFTHGKCWQGKNLQLVWAVPTNTASIHNAGEGVLSQISRGGSDAAAGAEKGSFGSANPTEKLGVNNVRITNNIAAERTMEGCDPGGHSVTELIEGGNQVESIQYSTPQLQECPAAVKSDGNHGSVSTLAQTDLSPCKTAL